MARVLVIDDEELVRTTISEVLRTAGHAVTAVENGTAALAHLDEEDANPDVIFCDIRMPEMGGVEFLRLLSLRQYGGAIVLISGLDKMTVDVARALATYRKLNIRGQIQKPLYVDDLLAAVDEALRPA